MNTLTDMNNKKTPELIYDIKNYYFWGELVTQKIVFSKKKCKEKEK